MKEPNRRNCRSRKVIGITVATLQLVVEGVFSFLFSRTTVSSIRFLLNSSFLDLVFADLSNHNRRQRKVRDR